MDSIYMEEPLAFDPAEWIGKKKQYPSNAEEPLGLWEYCKNALEIPAEQRLQLLPDPALSVQEFLALPLPQQSNALVNLKPETWFSPEPPNEDTIQLTSRVIPSRHHTEKLKDVFGQALLNGAKSIMDPYYKTSRLPLFAIKFWLEMHQVLDIQSKWHASTLWLRKQDENVPPPALDKACHTLRYLPWNGIISGPNSRGTVNTSTLTRLFGIEWINDDIVDIIAHHLQARLQANPQISAHTMIVDLSLEREIGKAKSPAHFDSLPRWLVRLEREIQSKDLPRLLYFSSHIAKQQHWICFQINFERQTLAYGTRHVILMRQFMSDSVPADSLAHKLPKPTKFVQQLQWWLTKRFGSRFREDNTAMACARQDDFHSCGIISINTITHHVFGDALWEPSSKVSERVQWFNTISEYKSDQVSTVSMFCL